MYVHWSSESVDGLSLDVPRKYHEEAEKLLEAVEDPIAFFDNLESYKKEMPLLEYRSVAEATFDIIKECEAERDCPMCRALRDRLYLRVIHNSMYMHNDEFSGSREKTYLDISKKMDRINDMLKELE